MLVKKRLKEQCSPHCTSDVLELSPSPFPSFSRYCFLQKTEKTEFLSFFYKYCMHVLTAPLLAAHDRNSKGGPTTQSKAL